MVPDLINRDIVQILSSADSVVEVPDYQQGDNVRMGDVDTIE